MKTDKGNSVILSWIETKEEDWHERTIPFIEEVLRFLKIKDYTLSLVLSDDNFIQSLNKQYRNKDNPTDILSFSHDKNSGDLILCLAGWLRNCNDFSVDKNEELKRLLVHGILHLQGWDHSEENPAGEMMDYQEEILKKIKGDIFISNEQLN